MIAKHVSPRCTMLVSSSGRSERRIRVNTLPSPGAASSVGHVAVDVGRPPAVPQVVEHGDYAVSAASVAAATSDASRRTNSSTGTSRST